MTAVTSPPAVDGDALMGFVFRAIDEVGASLNTALVVMGDRLGYYRALAEQGPLTPNSLAHLTNTAEPYAREWLAAQAAGGYLGYDPETRTFSISPEVAMAMTDETSPAYLPGFFQIAYGTIRDANRIFEAAATGDGLGWHDHNSDVHVGCERFFRPGYLGQPDRVMAAGARRRRGQARERREGRRHGLRPRLVQRADGAGVPRLDDSTARTTTAPRSTSPASGHRRPAWPIVPSSRWSGADGFSGTGFDLVTTFDALHDMGDPVGSRSPRPTTPSPTTARGWSSSRRPATTWRTTSTPVGRAYYGFSTLLAPGVAVPGGRAGARHPGRPGQDPRRRDGRRVHPVPDRRADPAQHHLRDPQVTAHPRAARGD